MCLYTVVQAHYIDCSNSGIEACPLLLGNMDVQSSDAVYKCIIQWGGAICQLPSTESHCFAAD